MAMKTSPSQFRTLVEFMERNGDLSSSGTGRSRLSLEKGWNELTAILNADVSGTSKSIDRWRKVWSDYKNNTRKKALCMKRKYGRIIMTDLERRVLKFSQLRRYEKLQKAEKEKNDALINNLLDEDFSVEEETPVSPKASPVEEQHTIIEYINNWNEPPTCLSPELVTVSEPDTVPEPAVSIVIPPPPPPPRLNERPKPINGLKKVTGGSNISVTSTPVKPDLTKFKVIKVDSEWRQYQMDKETREYELEREKLRLREMELQQKAKWQELCGQFLSIVSKSIDKYFEA